MPIAVTGPPLADTTIKQRRGPRGPRPSQARGDHVQGPSPTTRYAPMDNRSCGGALWTR